MGRPPGFALDAADFGIAVHGGIGAIAVAFDGIADGGVGHGHGQCGGRAGEWLAGRADLCDGGVVTFWPQPGALDIG